MVQQRFSRKTDLWKIKQQTTFFVCKDSEKSYVKCKWFLLYSLVSVYINIL